MATRPEGTLDPLILQSSLRDLRASSRAPNVETLGYCQKSLRDNCGALASATLMLPKGKASARLPLRSERGTLPAKTPRHLKAFC